MVEYHLQGQCSNLVIDCWIDLTQVIQKTTTNLILECVDKTLCDLGTGPAELAYALAKRSFGVPREEIALKPEAFEKALERVFGASSIIIERHISIMLFEAFNLPVDDSRTMPDLIAELSQRVFLT
jgi:hypothetical protein